jgi:hypothetical protein
MKRRWWKSGRIEVRGRKLLPQTSGLLPPTSNVSRLTVKNGEA